MKPEDTTILTVDDTPANIRLLTHYLEKQGYNVITADDGFEGFKAAIQYHPDLILLDVMMPGTDGYEVCELLKAEEETRDIPVVFLTAKTDVEDKIRGFELGAADYITKPFNLVEISARVQTQLDYKYLQNQNMRYHRTLLKMQRINGLSLIGGTAFERCHSDLNHLKKDFQKILKSTEASDPVGKQIEETSKKIDHVIEFTQTWVKVASPSDQEIEAIDVCELIQDIVDIIQDNVHGSIQIETDIIGEIPHLEGNHESLQQSIMCLFMNAYDNLEGVGQISVKVEEKALPENLTNQIEGQIHKAYIKIDIGETESVPLKDLSFSDSSLLYTNRDTSEWNINLSAAYWITTSHHGAMDLQSGSRRGMITSIYLPI